MAADGRGSRSSPYIAGIGASAGGLEALEELFKSMPVDVGIAFVVVQHLSPDFESMLDELLARRTALPVRRVTDGMPVEPGTVHLIPPRKDMIISDGRLLLSDKDRDKDLTLPIDIFFRSLARDAGDRAIGVVLSGTGSDGSRGLRAIHEAGGLVLVQSPDSAKFDGMPKNARDTGVADLILLPRRMPEALWRYVRHIEEEADATPELNETRGAAMKRILDLLHTRYGIDFGFYKPNTVSRRIDRRLLMHQDQHLADYAVRLEQDLDELDALYCDLLIGVTSFFRDTEAFERLEHDILPEIVRRLSPDEELRAWVAGCATGEEAYSLAILVREQMERAGRPVNAKIFATDVHRGSLERAGAGVYGKAALDAVSEERRARFFVENGESYRVAGELRQMVVFAPHNVIRDAPFTRLDFVSCRNLLIYLQPEAQRKVLSLLHFGLKTGGILLLGSSESTGPHSEDFQNIEERLRIYRKHREHRLPADARFPIGSRASASRPEGRPMPQAVSQLFVSYDALLDRYMPPALLVSEDRELLHSFGGASKYLHVGDGRPSQDVLELLDPDLKVAITGALQRARKSQEPVVYGGIATSSGERLRIRVEPAGSMGSRQPNVLIVFEPEEQRDGPPSAEVRELDFRAVSQEQLQQLEQELRHTKENLQATIEELETSNEELQATNEELVASNEELQSTNEELQSVNEELYTVNAEFQKKIQELTELTNDMDNLFAATDVGTLFLDEDLRIRKFTPRMAEVFSLQPQDLGRSVADFTHGMDRPSLLEDVRQVLRTGERCEHEVRDRTGRWFFLRILPYQSAAGVGGVVVTVVDIAALKRAERELFHARYLLDSLMDSLPDGIYFSDVRGRFVRVNKAFARRLGFSHPREVIGKRLGDMRSGSAAELWDLQDEQIRRTSEPVINALEQLVREDGTSAWYLTTKLALEDEAGTVVGTFGVSRDVTPQKAAEDRAREAVGRRDAFLAILSHELRNPLAAVLSAIDVLLEAPDEEPRDSAVDIIRRQAVHMARLLDDLLDVSRIAQDKIDLQREVVDLRTVLSDSLEAIRARASRAGVSLEHSVPDEPLWVDGDVARLRQVLVNLVTNAVKYNGAGGHVWVELETEGDDVLARVRDDGIGIDAEAVDTVFDMFVQVDDSLSRTDGGLGLGLALVRNLVEMHGGSVEAHSDGRGKGAEFVVRLPLAPHPGEHREERPSSPERPRPRPGGDTVVVVEDMDDNRAMLRVLLERRGYRVIEARDGVEGLDAILRHRPAVAVVDIGMPRMDGYELARAIRRRSGGRPIRLVALSGYGTAKDRALSEEAGFDLHVVKPVRPDVLAGLLGDVEEN